MSNNKDILSFDAFGDKPGKLSDEQLKAYLDGKLSAAEQHEVEKWLSEEGMEGDALEGLKQLDNKDVQQSVSRIDNRLRQKLAGKKRTRRSYYSDNKWSLIAIVFILVLCILAYLVFHYSKL